MSVIGVFAKGRPLGHENATSILRYVPRPRVPWQPSRFGRENLTTEDLAKLWGRGRYRTGPGNYNSGYSTEKTWVLEDHTIQIIPKHELEKFMPDISLGPKALVTPVSLMSARDGHRVTHDLIHSYDPYIGRLQKPANVDHDNIVPHDPNRVGLNPSTLDCRGRILRWLRRGPFFQEDAYFRRSTKINRDGTVPVGTHEAPLMRKILRLARRGHLKAACEEYRRVTTVPPVEVYRALTASCIPGALLADAIAIFEDGNARLFYVARDGEVLHNLMRCAVKAKHRVRVMWVFNVMRGRYYENVVVRSEVEAIWRYRISAHALEFLLDQQHTEEARTVYQYLVESGLLDTDAFAHLGMMMRKALSEGKTVGSFSPDMVAATSVMQNAVAVAPEVVRALYSRHIDAMQHVTHTTTTGVITHAPDWAMATTMSALGRDDKAADAVAWLETYFPDVSALAVLRLARFRHGAKDLMAKDRAAYVERAASWLEQLSSTRAAQEEAPLTYLRKSKPSATNVNVRVAWLPQRRHRTKMLAHEEGFRFFYDSAHPTRMVDETFPCSDSTLESRYLALQPIHVEVSAATDFSSSAQSFRAVGAWYSASRPDDRVRALHHSVSAELSGTGTTTPLASPAFPTTGAAATSAATLSIPSQAQTALEAHGATEGTASQLPNDGHF